MLASVVAQQCLLVFARETAVATGTTVGPTVGKYLVNPLLEMFHHQVILLLPVFVLGFGLEPAQLARVCGAEPVNVFRQARVTRGYQVQHH